MLLFDVVDNPSSRESLMPVIEQFIILLYDLTSDVKNGNILKHFRFKNRQIVKLAPTQGVLYQHIKRAKVYLSGVKL